MGMGIQVGFRGSSAGLSDGASAATSPSVPAQGCTAVPAVMRRQVKQVDGPLVAFPTIFSSIFITVKQANTAFAEVQAENL